MVLYASDHAKVIMNEFELRKFVVYNFMCCYPACAVGVAITSNYICNCIERERRVLPAAADAASIDHVSSIT